MNYREKITFKLRTLSQFFKKLQAIFQPGESGGGLGGGLSNSGLESAKAPSLGLRRGGGTIYKKAHNKLCELNI